MFDKLFGGLFGQSPAEYNLRLVPANIDLRASNSQTLLQVALGQGIPFPHNCRAGGCGECKCRLVEGRVKELTDKSYLLSVEELRSNYILACQSIPRSDVVVEVDLTVGLGHPIIEVFGTVTSVELLTHDIMHLIVNLEQSITFSSGQYAELSLIDIAENVRVTRSYSFADCPARNGMASTVSFFIREVPGGQFSPALFREAAPGMRLKIGGPFGDFYLREATAPILCIAGGSGLAPIMAILRDELQKESKGRDVTVIFGARSREDLYLQAEIAEIGAYWKGRFNFVPVLSNESVGGDWQGRRGFIAPQLKEIVGDQLVLCHAYLCGPPPLIDSCVVELKEAGINPSFIHFDKFIDLSHSASKPAHVS